MKKYRIVSPSQKTYFYSRSIAITFGIFVVVLSVLLGIFEYQKHSSQQKSYNHLKDTQLEQLASSVATTFQTCEQLSYEISKSTWFSKWQSPTKAFNHEFSNYRQSEITGEIHFKIHLAEPATDIAVIVPHQDFIICRHGFLTLRDFESVGVVDTSILNNPPKTVFSLQESTDPEYLSFIYCGNIYSENQRFYICFTIEKEKLSDQVYNYNLSQFDRITVNDLTVLDESAHKELLEITKQPRTYLTVSASYPSYSAEQFGVTYYLYFILVVLLISATGTFVLGWFFEYPLLFIQNTLLKTNRLMQNPQHLFRELEKVLADNQSMTETLALWNKTVRDATLYELLTDPDFSLYKRLDKVMDFSYRDYPCFAIICEKKERKTLYPINTGIHTVQIIELDFYGNDLFTIVWSENLETAIQNRCIYQNAFEEINHLHIAITDIVTDISQIHPFFLTAKRQYEIPVTDTPAVKASHETSKTPATLPAEVQILLVNALMNNKLDKQKAFIERLKSHIIKPEEKRHLLIMLRTFAEASYPTSLETIDLYSKQLNSESHTVNEDQFWEDMLLIVSYININISLYQESAKSEESVIYLIEDYVNDNFCAPELSLKFLSERFDIDTSSLSRLYKSHTGFSFSEHVLRLRTEKAKELLLNTDDNLPAIGHAIGYENYYSFKRAFMRIETLSPKEYREKFQVKE